jgi:RNA polymerase sigma factor (sigma-70 family)
MSVPSIEVLQRYLRRLCDEAVPPEDAVLLNRFVTANDREAFELLIARHGPMVLGTARRLVDNTHDAEDVFQAVFLSLARLAKSIRQGRALPAWLHKTTCRVAAKLRANRPVQSAPTPERYEHCDPGAGLVWREVCQALDEELQRLPERLRSPLLLCYLSGLTRDEAAKQLGWSLGTLKRRLEEGRKTLRIRLAKRGIASVGVALTVLTPDALQAAVSKSLLESSLCLIFSTGAVVPATISALVLGSATTLKGVAMKSIIALLAVIALGVGVYAGMSQADPPKNLDAPTAKSAASKAPAAKSPDADADALPAGALARLGSPRLRHGARLKDIAYSPTGKRLASVGYDDTLRAWDAETGRQIFAVKRPEGGFDKVSFAAEGTVIVALGRDPDKQGVLWRIEAATGKVLDRLKLEAVLPKATMPEAAAVRFSADGSRLALGSADKKQLLVIDTSSAKVIWTADLGKETPGGVTFAPDGKTVAVATNAGRVYLFDRDGKPTAQFKTKGNAELASVALSPDGKLVTACNSGSPSRELIAWDRATGQILWTQEHKGGHGLAFTPDSTIIVECGSRTFASTIDAANGMAPGNDNKRDALFESMAEVRCLALHPGANVVAFGTDSGTICLFDVATRKPVPPTAEPSRFVERLRFSADGKTVYGWALDWLAWDVATGKQRYVTNAGGWDFNVPLSPDGKYITWTSRLSTGIVPENGTRIEVRDAATGKAVHSLRTKHSEGAFDYWYDFTPAGKAIIVCQTDGSMQIWSLDGEMLARMSGHKGAPVYHAFSASAPVMVTATLDDPPEEFSVRVWDLKNGKELAKFKPGVGLMGNGYMYGSLVALSGDGRRVAALTYANSFGKPERNERATVWDVASGKVLATVPQGGDSGCIALSPDGRMVAVSAFWKSDVWVYEVASDGERFHFRHGGEVTGLAFAPDGRTLAAASKEAPVLLWDVSGKLAEPVPKWNADAADRVWADLAADPVKGFAAMRMLRSEPEKVIPFLKERTKLPSAPAAEVLKRLLADLDSEDFTTREKATEALGGYGESIRSDLEAELKRTTSAEARNRLTGLVTRLDAMSPARIRLVRAVEALEGMSGKEVRSLLEFWASGTAGTALASEAKATLARRRE